MRLRPLTGYVGGKWFLSGRISPLIDAHQHTAYVEVFLGMGNVFLGRKSRPKVEVVNDRNDELVTLFRVVQRHPDELVRQVRWQMTSRTEYTRLRQVDTSTLTDVERAARFLVLRRMTFSGKDDYAAGFGISKKTRKVFDVGEVQRRIEALHKRLDRVVIENLDWRDLIANYDAESTFFYLDPPYFGHTHLYSHGRYFGREDFEPLAEAMRRVRGRWLMSINDRPEVRKLFEWANIQPIETRYNAQVGKGSQRVSELLIGSA